MDLMIGAAIVCGILLFALLIFATFGNGGEDEDDGDDNEQVVLIREVEDGEELDLDEPLGEPLDVHCPVIVYPDEPPSLESPSDDSILTPTIGPDLVDQPSSDVFSEPEPEPAPAAEVSSESDFNSCSDFSSSSDTLDCGSSD